ncbi:hypothetical protein EPN18_01030 [bacterium]|nr:MAG: hypothetical protein EPN18_01030 [bacterium]
MPIIKSLRFSLIMVALLFMAGCANHVGNFSALATGTYRSENVNEKHLVAKNVDGESLCWHVLMIPTCVYPKLDQAVSEALSKHNGDYMQNSRVYWKYTWYFLVDSFGWRVEGDVYKTNE